MIKFGNHDRCPYCIKSPLLLVQVQKNEKLKKYCDEQFNMEQSENTNCYCCSSMCSKCIIL